MEDDPFGDPPMRLPAAAVSSPATSLTLARPRWGLRGQLVLVILVVVSSGFLGLCVHQIVAGVGMSADSLAQLSLWSWLIVPAMIACFTATVLCIVAFVRTQASRLLIAIGTLTSLVLPAIAAYVGGRIGFDRAALNLGGDLQGVLSDVDLTPFLEWLLSLFGGG